MDLDEIEEALTGQDLTGTDAIVGLVLIAIGVAAYWLVGRILRRSSQRWNPRIPGEVVEVAIRLCQFLTLGVFVAWALSVLGADGNWLTVLVLAILIGGAFLARPFFDALASSVAVAISEFTVGDEIEVDGMVGKIEQIANRGTIVRTRDGRRVHIPNSELIDKSVTVYTAYGERRSEVDVTLALDTKVDEAKRIIGETLADLDSVNRIGAIRARGLGEGIDLSIRFWHGPTIEEGNDAVDAVVVAVKDTFDRHGISFAPASSLRIEDSASQDGVEPPDS